MKGSAYVFINFVQAARFGHVGWGFSLDDGQSKCYFGSTDHLYRHKWWDLPAWVRYAHLAPEMDNDWWSDVGSRDDMLHLMNHGHQDRYHIWYHACKEIPVTVANPEGAIKAAEHLRGNGWSLLVNNCVHQAYNVLTEYGAVLPEPTRPIKNLIPKNWFAQIDGNLLTF